MDNNLHFDISIEETILSSFIFNGTIPDSLNENIFYINIHKSIYRSIVHLVHNNLSVDELLIKNYLVSELNIDTYLAEEYLLKILTTTPTSNIQKYIDILNELRKKRDIKTVLLQLNQELYEDKTIDELENTLHTFTQKIAQDSIINLFSMVPASSIKAKDAEFITKTFIPIPKKTVSIFTASGGTGKTLLLLQVAMRYLYENENEKAFCWLSEDPLELTKHRLNLLIDKIFNYGSSTLERLILSDDLTFPILVEKNRSFGINTLFYKMKTLLKDFNLIIFDPLIAFFGADENNNSHAKLFMQLFTHWANEENKTIIFIHHSTKNTSQSRGASAFIDAARAVYEIEKIVDKNNKEIISDKRKVTLTKDNYRASKYFGGYSKNILVFPPEINNKQKNKNILIDKNMIKSNNIDEELGIQ